MRRPDGTEPHELQPGEYAKWKETWWCATPRGAAGNLANHEVTEHDDGTITVTPSILIKHGDKEVWHGFLTNGVWSEC